MIYSLFLFNRLFFGPIHSFFIRFFCDSSRLETNILLILFVISVFFGFIPYSFSQIFTASPLIQYFGFLFVCCNRLDKVNKKKNAFSF